MQTLTVDLPDEIATRADQLARERGVSLEELVRISLEEALARDEEFESAAERVLSKNVDLYERLA